MRKVREKIERLKLLGWLSEKAVGREILPDKDSVALGEEAKLDGCYVLKTDLRKEVATKETIHDRYSGGVVNGDDYYTPQGSGAS